MTDITRIPRMIRARVWEGELDRLPRWRAVPLYALRGLWAVMRDLHAGDLNLHAMSLVYTTILSIVPLLAVSFSVLKGFGVHEQLEVALMDALLPLGEQGAEIGRRIMEFVGNVKAGVLGSLGLAFLLYTAVSLMQKIEHAFNVIWHVPEERPLTQRFSYYLSVILVGPVLIFSSLGISASLMSTEVVSTLSAIEPFGTLIGLVGLLLPFLLVMAAFTFIYLFIPNTQVRITSALAGALVGGLLWNLAGWAFAAFVVTSAKYTAIYSAFAALIVFMLWLYVAWLVLLVGASVAFYHQHPEHLSLQRGEDRLSPRMAERLALALLAEIAADFSAARPRPALDVLAARLRIPGGIAAGLVHAMERAGLIVASGEAPPGWLPARPPDAILLSDAMAAVRADGEILTLSPGGVAVAPAVDALVDRLEQSRETALAGQTLADLAAGARQPEPAPAAALRPTGRPGDAAE